MMLWILACGDDAVPESTGGGAEEYAGPMGRLIEWAPVGTPEGDTVTLLVEHGLWTFEGADGTLRQLAWVLDEAGFAVEGTYLLPNRLAVGSSAEGVEVVATGAVDVWYGTFPDCVTVEVAAGDWAGTQVFARDIGLVAATWQGSWEAVYYE